MLAFAAAITTEAQTITLDMNGGAETCYSVGDIDYIDFTPDTGCVDLGLSVAWAKCNLGANSPNAYGQYYSWGETDSKSIYADSTYVYSSLTPYGHSNFINIGSDIASSIHDAATAALGGKWRMPTRAEMQKRHTLRLHGYRPERQQHLLARRRLPRRFQDRKLTENRLLLDIDIRL